VSDEHGLLRSLQTPAFLIAAEYDDFVPIVLFRRTMKTMLQTHRQRVAIGSGTLASHRNS
jgi:hypothetical protein